MREGNKEGCLAAAGGLLLLLTVTANSLLVAVTARAVGPRRGPSCQPAPPFLSPGRDSRRLQGGGPAFTDAIRMYRQSKELYGTWEMLCVGTRFR